MAEMYTVVFYGDAAGKEPVREFLEQQSPKMQAKVLRTLELLERNGPEVHMPYSRALNDGLFELRVTQSGNALRIIYFYDAARIIILAHAFSKKTKKTPRREIDLAKKRMIDYMGRSKR